MLYSIELSTTAAETATISRDKYPKTKPGALGKPTKKIILSSVSILSDSSQIAHLVRISSMDRVNTDIRANRLNWSVTAGLIFCGKA